MIYEENCRETFSQATVAEKKEYKIWQWCDDDNADSLE